MVHETVEVPVADLLFDLRNPRLPAEAESQREAAIALTKVIRGRQLLVLAKHILDHGLDPFYPMVVVPTDDEAKRYTVYEGNRRLLALKALDTPQLVAPALSSSEQSRLAKLSRAFQKNPIETVRANVAKSLEDVVPWISLRHAGFADGAGLSEWGPDEKERFKIRHLNAKRSEVGQVIDFLEKEGLLERMGEDGPAQFQTNLRRLISTPEAREALGLKFEKGQVYALYPKEEIAKALSYVVNEFATGAATVKDIYHSVDRKKYVKGLPADVLPSESTKLKAAVPLEGIGDGAPPSVATPPPAAQPARRRRPTPRPRTTVIPRDVDLDIDDPRINKIYIELKTLNLEDFTNAGAVILRVFLELNLDTFLAKVADEPEETWSRWPLAKKLKVGAEKLHRAGKIPLQLKTEVCRMADQDRQLGATIITLHQYVHNPYTFPRASDVYTTWDTLQPFIEQLWK